MTTPTHELALGSKASSNIQATARFCAFLFGVMTCATGATAAATPVGPSFAALAGKFAGRSFTDLELLNEVAPRWQKTTAVLHHSRSPYGATPEFPRLLAFSPNGRFAVAVNTNPDHPLRNVVELLEQGDDGLIRPRVIERTAAGARFIENPQAAYPQRAEFQCTRCHSEHVHFNWDGYPSWPEAFGAQAHARDASEDALFQRLTASAQARRFDWFEAWRPTLSQLNSNNQTITSVVQLNNARRIVALLKASPKFEVLKDAMVAAASGSLVFELFLPAEQRALYRAQSPALVKEVDTAHLEYQDAVTKRFRRYGLPYTGHPIELPGRTYAKIEFVARAMGVDTSAWWTTLEKSSYSGDAPVNRILNFEIARALVRDFNRHDPRFRSIGLPPPLNFGLQSVGSTVFSALHLAKRTSCEMALTPRP